MPRYLAPKDAARILDVTTARVQQLDREGKLPAMRDSANRRFFEEAAVLRLLETRRHEAARRKRASAGQQRRSSSGQEP